MYPRFSHNFKNTSQASNFYFAKARLHHNNSDGRFGNWATNQVAAKSIISTQTAYPQAIK